jgi:hypothetical protein
LLTFLVAGVPFFAPDNSSKQPGAFSQINVQRFVAMGKATVRLAFQKYCLVDYDVTGSLPRPLARGHAGRHCPAGPT